MTAEEIVRSLLDSADRIAESPQGITFLLVTVPDYLMPYLEAFGSDTDDDEGDDDREQDDADCEPDDEDDADEAEHDARGWPAPEDGAAA